MISHNGPCASGKKKTKYRDDETDKKKPRRTGNTMTKEGDMQQKLASKKHRGTVAPGEKGGLPNGQRDRDREKLLLLKGNTRKKSDQKKTDTREKGKRRGGAAKYQGNQTLMGEGNSSKAGKRLTTFKGK